MRVLVSKLYGIFPTLLIWATMAGFPVLAHAGPIESGHSAMWFDPARSGEGWVLEILHDDHALLYWYTYDEKGNQRWLQAVGEIVREEEGDAIEFPELYVTRGGRFGPEFNPDEVEIEIVGEARMTFIDCDRGEFFYSAFGQSQTIAIQRLSQTMAAGCAPIHGVTGEPVREYAGQSGSWFDPSHSGEGFSMHWLSRDEALVTWYSYDSEGNQYWMLGVGHFDDGKIVFPELHSTRGARFGEDFDSGDVEQIAWGSLEMELECDNGTARFESLHPEFGTGTFELIRLTALERPGCPWIAPKLWDLYDITWNEIPIPDGELIGANTIADDGTIAARREIPAPDGYLSDYYLTLWRPDEQRWQSIEGEIDSGVRIAHDASGVSASRLVRLKREPLIWREETGWNPLPGMIFEESFTPLPSKDFSRLVGVGSYSGDDQKIPWIWNAEDGQRELPLTDQIPGPAPYAVSNDGNIVVGNATPPNLIDAGIGIRWVNGDDPEYLYSDEGELLGSAGHCNQDCSVVLGINSADPIPRKEAWYWTPDGRFGWLGTLPDADLRWPQPYSPRAITWDGNLIVGHYLIPNAENLPRARGFVWTQNTGIVSLRTLILELGIGDEDRRNMLPISVSSTGDKILLTRSFSGNASSGENQLRAVVLKLSPKQ